jgi:molybdopterin/thiamine biosynthesis adenylyltransferase
MTGVTQATRHVVIVGCGNIGGYLCDLLARMSEIGRLTLIDMDTYTDLNVRGQAIARSDVGRPKAKAQARRLRQIREDLEVTAAVEAVENVPLGALRGDVICSCLDSRVSRMTVNEDAWRLGIPWIDAGVLASQNLARCEVFVPGDEFPCLECAFTHQHYDTMEVRHLCAGHALAAPTRAPAYLGAFAASLQAAACHRLLRGQPAEPIQLIAGLERQEKFVSHNRRNSGCRFDHRTFAPSYSGRRTLSDLLTGRSSTIAAAGKRLAVGGPCPRCRRGREVVRSVAANEIPVTQCAFCKVATTLHPDAIFERLPAERIPARLLSRSPLALGLRDGDLFTVRDAGSESHYLLGNPLYARRQS